MYLSLLCCRWSCLCLLSSIFCLDMMCSTKVLLSSMIDNFRGIFHNRSSILFLFCHWILLQDVHQSRRLSYTMSHHDSVSSHPCTTQSVLRLFHRSCISLSSSYHSSDIFQWVCWGQSLLHRSSILKVSMCHLIFESLSIRDNLDPNLYKRYMSCSSHLSYVYDHICCSHHNPLVTNSNSSQTFRWSSDLTSLNWSHMFFFLLGIVPDVLHYAYRICLGKLHIELSWTVHRDCSMDSHILPRPLHQNQEQVSSKNSMVLCILLLCFSTLWYFCYMSYLCWNWMSWLHKACSS